MTGLIAPTTGTADREAPQLAGFTIVLTSDRRSEELATSFARRGAEILRAPVIRIVPLAEDDRLVAATRAVIADPPDDVVVVSGRRVAVQLHGYTDTELLERLTGAGALVSSVAVYRWGPSPDPTAVRKAIDAVCAHTAPGSEAFLEAARAARCPGPGGGGSPRSGTRPEGGHRRWGAAPARPAGDLGRRPAGPVRRPAGHAAGAGRLPRRGGRPAPAAGRAAGIGRGGVVETVVKRGYRLAVDNHACG